ncbi:MAG: DMT family transporter [Bdellovibrionaceae bacterium]|jgi:drug/metabolite transporter (DMT)-like permease|nr:DMT family transporter [Pseudobdellovibrionaceae bacterium]
MESILLAIFFFSIAHSLVKELKHIPVEELVFFRALMTTVLGFFFAKYKGISLKPNHKINLLLRSVYGLMALVLFFYSLQSIPLSLAITLQYTSPIFMVIFAVFMLDEKPKLSQVALFLLAILGVVVIKQTPQDITIKGLIIGLMAAFFAGLAYTYIRKLKDTDHPLVVVFYFPLVALLLFTPIMIKQGFVIQYADYFKMLVLGIFTFLAQVFLTQVYQEHKGADVGVLHYTGLVYAIAIGFVFYDEVPDIYQLVGMAMIISAVFINKKTLKNSG